jgi:hypothetical protein
VPRLISTSRGRSTNRTAMGRADRTTRERPRCRHWIADRLPRRGVAHLQVPPRRQAVPRQGLPRRTRSGAVSSCRRTWYPNWPGSPNSMSSGRAGGARLDRRAGAGGIRGLVYGVCFAGRRFMTRTVAQRTVASWESWRRSQSRTQRRRRVIQAGGVGAYVAWVRVHRSPAQLHRRSSLSPIQHRARAGRCGGPHSGRVPVVISVHRRDIRRANATSSEAVDHPNSWSGIAHRATHCSDSANAASAPDSSEES